MELPLYARCVTSSFYDFQLHLKAGEISKASFHNHFVQTYFIGTLSALNYSTSSQSEFAEVCNYIIAFAITIVLVYFAMNHHLPEVTHFWASLPWMLLLGKCSLDAPLGSAESTTQCWVLDFDVAKSLGKFQ